MAARSARRAATRSTTRQGMTGRSTSAGPCSCAPAIVLWLVAAFSQKRIVAAGERDRVEPGACGAAGCDAVGAAGGGRGRGRGRAGGVRAASGGGIHPLYSVNAFGLLQPSVLLPAVPLAPRGGEAYCSAARAAARLLVAAGARDGVAHGLHVCARSASHSPRLPSATTSQPTPAAADVPSSPTSIGAAALSARSCRRSHSA